MYNLDFPHFPTTAGKIAYLPLEQWPWDGMHGNVPDWSKTASSTGHFFNSFHVLANTCATRLLFSCSLTFLITLNSESINQYQGVSKANKICKLECSGICLMLLGSYLLTWHIGQGETKTKTLPHWAYANKATNNEWTGNQLEQQ